LYTTRKGAVQDRHADQIIHIRAEAKTIEDFSYLPGINNKDRFERLVAVGLRAAEKQIDKPAAPIDDRRARLDSIMARFNEPAAPEIRSSLDGFDAAEIIAHVKTWGCKESMAMARMLSQRVAEEGWQA
jgi:hypothetical protein